MDSLRKLFTKALSPDYTYQSLYCALPLYDSEKFPRIQGLWKKPCRKSILSDLPSGLHIQKLEFHNIPHSLQEHLVHIVFRIMASALSTPKIRYHSSACPLSKNKLYQQHITNGSSHNG